MHRTLSRFVWVALAAGFLASTLASQQTALDRYVAKPDPNYSYKLVNKMQAEGATVFVLEMTSQQYLTTNEVDKPIWKHWVTIVKPDQVTSTTGFLFITGGANDRPAPGNPDPNMARIAVASKSIVTELKGIPSEPLTFKDEGRPRSEDGIIAYTWDKFLRTGDEKWPLRLPMTKAAVRAMDTVTSFCSTEEAGKLKVDSFVVAGGSKRGWTTWTTAIVDKRVKAIAPLVIDLLNIVPSFEHHFEAYGFWAPAVGDYKAMGIMDWSGTPEYAALMKIEEPFEYRDRLTMPKFMINAGGDQFFLPDSAQFYWKDLPGPKWIRYIPNTDHSLKNSDAHQTLLAYYWAILNDRELPQLTWTLDGAGNYDVKSTVKAESVKLWQANNPNARDFRLEAVGPIYQSKDLTANGDGTFKGNVEKPEKGFTAYFVEFTYNIGAPAPLKLTTEVRVTPDELPFKGKIPKRDPHQRAGN
jgi:PhoPQ-activated pathogenicity-related protein